MQDVATRLAANLQEEQKTVKELLDVLRKEQDCLVAADTVTLPLLTDEKARIASRMSELARGRYHVLADAGFEASEAGMEKWSTSAGAVDTVRNAWNDLLAAARDGKEYNRLNGVLIQQQIARSHNALNVLFSHSQASNTYGADGQSTTQMGSRRLGVG